jgi:hypothetical protein
MDTDYLIMSNDDNIPLHENKPEEKFRWLKDIKKLSEMIRIVSLKTLFGLQFLF